MVIVIIIITYKLLSYIFSSLEICFYLIKGNVLSSFNYFILPKQSLSLVQHLGHKVMPCLPHPLLRPVPDISPPAPPSRWPCTCAMDVIVPVCIGHHFVCVGGHYCTVPVWVNHYHDMRQLIFPFFFFQFVINNEKVVRFCVLSLYIKSVRELEWISLISSVVLMFFVWLFSHAWWFSHL